MLNEYQPTTLPIRPAKWRLIKPDSKGPATAMAAPSNTALPIRIALACPTARSNSATAITAIQRAMVRSSPRRIASRGANGASKPMHNTGSAVVRLIRLRLKASSSAIRSISGAREVIPGRKLIAARIRPSNSRARGKGFTVNPSVSRPCRHGRKP